MTNRDQELDELLSSLRKVEPNTLQVARWKKALKQSPMRKKLNYRFLSSLAAAVIFGFVLGMSASKLSNKEDNSQDYSFASATKVERFVNTESDDY
jgi:hypothetical protein